MKKLLSIIALLLLTSQAHAELGRSIIKGSTSQTSYVRIINATTGIGETGVTEATSGIDLEYVRLGAAPVDIVEDDLTTTDQAWLTGGIKHLGGGNYRIDLPDAACVSAAGVNSVMVQGTITGMIVIPTTHPLIAFDVYDPLPPVDTRELLGTAINANAPDGFNVAFQNVTADGASNTSIDELVSVSNAVGGVVATLSNEVVATGTLGATGNTTTTLHLPGLAHTVDEINGQLLVILDVSTGLRHSVWIEDWNATTDIATVRTLPFTPQASVDTYALLSARHAWEASTRTITALPTGTGAGQIYLAGGKVAILDNQTGQLATGIATDGDTTSIDSDFSTGNYAGCTIVVYDASSSGYSSTSRIAFASDDAVSVEPAFGFNVDSGDTWVIYRDSVDGAPTAPAIADAVWDEARSGHTTSGTFGQYTLASMDYIHGDALVEPTINVPGATSLATGFSKWFKSADGSLASTLSTAEIGKLTSMQEAMPDLTYRWTAQSLSQAGPQTYQGSIGSLTSQTVFTITNGATVDDFYNGQTVYITDPSDKRTVTSNVVLDYDGTLRRITLATAPASPIANSDPVRIVNQTATGGTAPTVVEIANQVWNTHTPRALTDGSIVAATIGTGAIDADAIATDAIGTAEISAAFTTEIANAVSAIWAGATVELTPAAITAIDDAISDETIPGAVWDELKASHVIPDSFGDYVDDEISEGGNAAAIATAVWQTAIPGTFTAGQAGYVMNAIATKTGYLPSATAGTAGGVLVAGSNADTTFATFTSTGNLTVNGNVMVAQSGDSYSRLGAPATTSIAADIAAIENQTDDIGIAGAGLTAVSAEATLTPEDIDAIAADVAAAVGSEVAVGVWDYATALADTPNSMGLLLTTNINETIASRAPENGGRLQNVSNKTTYLPNATAGQTGGLLIAGNNAATTFASLNATLMTIASVNHTAQTGDSFARIGSNGASLTALPWNAAWDDQAQSEADDALRALHLHYLFETAYNPASKPGTATGLLNVLVENDGGVPRFTTNSLEQAPSGSGASPAVIADAVWDEAKSGHNNPDSFGDYLDDEISSIVAGSGLDAAGVREAIGLAEPNLDTQLDAIPTAAEFPENFVDLAIAATTGEVTTLVELTQENIDQIGEAVIAGAEASDVNIESVPSSRNFKLVQSSSGLVSESIKEIIAGAPPNTYGVDFKDDAATNQKVYSVESIEIVSGTADGLTFSAAEDWGKEGTQAKFRITGVTPGDYRVRVTIKYSNVSGPTSRGDIRIKVVP